MRTTLSTRRLPNPTQRVQPYGGKLTSGPGALKRASTPSRLAVVGLLTVTAAWGSTFVLLDDATSRIPAADYSVLRFGLATLVLAALKPVGVIAMPSRLRLQAVLIGLLFGGGNLLLTAGLAHTTASTSGFVTGMYVVFTPIFGAVLLRERIRGTAWVAVLCAAAGLGVISLGGGGALGLGELMTLGGAALFALQIIALGRWSKAEFAIEVAMIQAAMTTLVALVFALPGGITTPTGSTEWLALLYMAVVVGAVTLLLQTWAQTRIQPARAAVIMTLEPVWAAGFAVAIGGELLSWRMAGGGGLILIAMYLTERR